MKKAAKSEEGNEDEAEEDSEKKLCHAGVQQISISAQNSKNRNRGGGTGEAEADPPVSASFVLACCTCSIEMRSAFCPKDLCQIKEKKARAG